MRLNNWPGSESRIPRDRKTIREWEQEYGIFILDLDGFDKTDPKLYERLFSQSEFEQAAAECTILHRKPGEQAATLTDTLEPTVATKGMALLGALSTVFANIKNAFGAINAKGKHQKQTTMRRPQQMEAATANHPDANVKPTKHPAKQHAHRRFSNLGRKSLIGMLVLTTIPTLLTIGLNWLYRQLQSRWRIPWYVPAAILGLDAFILWIQPVSPIISGPLYTWYVLFNEVSLILHGLITFIKVNLLHRPPGLTAAAPVPFLSSFSLAGNAVPLYFSFGKALTSGVFIGTVITFVRDVLQRMFTLKKS